MHLGVLFPSGKEAVRFWLLKTRTWINPISQHPCPARIHICRGKKSGPVQVIVERIGLSTHTHFSTPSWHRKEEHPMNFRGAWISAYGADMGNKARWQTAPPAPCCSQFCVVRLCPHPRVWRQDGECLTPPSSHFSCVPVSLKAAEEGERKAAASSQANNQRKFKFSSKKGSCFLLHSPCAHGSVVRAPGSEESADCFNWSRISIS